MKDEIKEILNNANKDTKFKMVDENGAEKEMNLAGFIEQLLNDNKTLLDCITNLQEEVNKLTAESTEWESKCYDLQEENERLKNEPLTNKISRIDSVVANIYKEHREQEDYKQRNEKAIEFINYYAIENDDYSKIYNVEEKELLNILKGE